MIRLVFVSSNHHKIREFTAIARNWAGYEIGVLDYSGIEEIQSLDSKAIAARKAVEAASFVSDPAAIVVVEDVSLCLAGMGDLPGPFIKYFTTELGAGGLYKLAAGLDSQDALAKCAYAALINGVMVTAVGACRGKIVAPRAHPGNIAFGFDAVFQPEGSEQTYAEMLFDEKQKISHRGLALASLKEQLDQILF